MSIPVVFRNHFQAGYVVRDIDAAMANMRDTFGIANWEIRRPPPTAPAKTLAFAYVQRLMIELIEVRPGEDTIYHAWIPEVAAAIRFHHLAYMIDSAEDWRAVIAQFESAGVPTALTGSAGDLLDYHYVDTVPQLGHYCEFVRLKPAGRNFWANVPQN